MIFDPIFITYQIVAIQCSFYLIMGTLWGLSHVLFQHPINLERLFTPNYINFTSISGWIDVLCTFTSAVAG